MLAEGEQAQRDDGVGGDRGEQQQQVEALAEVCEQDEAAEEGGLDGGGGEEEGAVGALGAVDAVERGASRRVEVFLSRHDDLRLSKLGASAREFVEEHRGDDQRLDDGEPDDRPPQAVAAARITFVFHGWGAISC